MTYLVEVSDQAQDEADQIVFRISARFGPDTAARWYKNLLNDLASLSTMPKRWAVAEGDAPAYPYTEVRRLLSGTGRMVYRVLFHIIEPSGDAAEGVVRVLRIRHAAMRPLGQTDAPDEQS